MSEEEKKIFDEVLENKVIEYIRTYKDRPCYLKVPLWIFEHLKQRFMGVMKIEYVTGRFCYEGLYVCETTSISKIEEIEVF